MFYPGKKTAQLCMVSNGGKTMEKLNFDFESVFKLIEPQKLRLNDKFMSHEPRTSEQKMFYERLTAAIEIGVPAFRAPIMDPSFQDKAGTKITYAAGKETAWGKSTLQWIELAKNLCPEKNSRLGSATERVVFTGMLMKVLTEEQQIPVKAVWSMICDDSAKIGHYCDSHGAGFKYEKTGCRKVAGFYDWGNMCKLVVQNNIALIVGGNAKVYGDMYPLTHTDEVIHQNSQLNYAVGWVVTDP